MGARHDMRLAKRHLAELYPYKIVIADKGYQGLAKTGLQTPKKKGAVLDNQEYSKVIKIFL